MAITEADAFEAMLAHHRTLQDQVARRVATLQQVVDSGGTSEPAVAELVAYMADEVLPHAIAEEHAIYQAASDVPGPAATVPGMIAEHRQLATLVESLAMTPSVSTAAEIAASIDTLFAAHVTKENDLILTPLHADDTVSLPELLVQMHQLTEEAQQETPVPDGASAPDTDAALLALVVEAAGLLAETGRGDQACRLVAQAWVALRAPRPDLAVRVTATLHRLVRTVTAEPVVLSARASVGAPSGAPAGASAGSSDGDTVLDVRELAPAQRHETIFAAYDVLEAGAGFVLVNDHDPKPLRYQFEAEHAGQHTWDYLDQGPRVWRVRIGRVPGAGA